jgi:hypothetical protein
VLSNPKTATPTTPLLLSEPETRRVLGGISARTLFNYRRDGLLPFVKVGTRTFYRPEDLERFVAERRQGGQQ